MAAATPTEPSPPDRPVAIITGSTSGIGLEIARRLHRDGMTVIITGRDHARGTGAAAEIGTHACFMPADLAVSADRVHLIEAVAASHLRLDVLVNNAALDHTRDLLDIPDEEIHQLFEINAVAAIALTRLAARHMPYGGSIVNITSRLAAIGVPTMTLYSATKGALKSFTTAAAVELAPRNIRVNAVAPGMTRTPLYQSWLDRQDHPELTEATVIRDIPLGRLATPADIASVVSFLASPQAEYITGVTIPVDGGYTAR